MKQNLARNPRAKEFARMRLEEIREFEGQRVDEFMHPLYHLLLYFCSGRFLTLDSILLHRLYNNLCKPARESTRERTEGKGAREA